MSIREGECRCSIWISIDWNPPEELIALGWDEYLEAGGVIIAEWGDKFPELMPPQTVWLNLSIAADGSRSIRQASS